MDTHILPNELWLNIISYLNIHEICILCIVCKHLNDICMDDVCWKYRFIEKYGDISTLDYTYRNLYYNLCNNKIKIVSVYFTPTYPSNKSKLGNIILLKQYNYNNIYSQILNLLKQVHPQIKSIHDTYYLDVYKPNSSFHCPISLLNTRKYSEEWKKENIYGISIAHHDLIYQTTDDEYTHLTNNSVTTSQNYIIMTIRLALFLLRLIV